MSSLEIQLSILTELTDLRQRSKEKIRFRSVKMDPYLECVEEDLD